MIWRRGFVYAHSPLPKNLTGRKFDLVFTFAHSPFPSGTIVCLAVPIHPVRFSGGI
jgi:hypothetical protein